MKRPVVFVAMGMLLAFVVIAGVVMVASEALAGARLRELRNGDIDVNIVLSQPTQLAGAADSRAGDALRQRDQAYESQLREMARTAATPTPVEPIETPTARPTLMPAPTARPARPTVAPTLVPTAVPPPAPATLPPAQPQTQPAQPTAPPEATQVNRGNDNNDDRDRDRNTPEPPVPTEERRENGDDSRGPSPDNTPRPDERPDERPDDSRRDDDGNSGRDKLPDPPKDDKP